MARSRAGLGLTIIALFGVFALGFSNRSAGFGAMAINKLLVGAIVLVVIFSLQFALYRVLDRFPDPLSDDRLVMASTTIEAARAYMPLGSGLGTFVPVYAMFEKPEDAKDTYVNRAHNDLLEVWLEAGVLGLALIGLFVIWLVRRSVEIWRSAPAPGASQLDWSLVRAATIVPALLLAHSLVDFPLRTGAMMAIMAFACALLIESPVGAEGREEAKLQAVPERTRHRDRHGLEPALSSAKPAPKSNPQVKTGLEPALSSARPAPKPNLQVKTSDAPSHPSSQRWGADIEWPKEWSKAANSPSPDGKDAPPKEQREPPAIRAFADLRTEVGALRDLHRAHTKASARQIHERLEALEHFWHPSLIAVDCLCVSKADCQHYAAAKGYTAHDRPTLPHPARP